MHDLREIRENPEAFDAAMRKRGLGKQAQKLIMLSSSLLAGVALLEANQARRNIESERVSQISSSRKGKEDRAEAIKTAKETKQEIAQLKEKIDDLKSRMFGKILELPNVPAANVPEGDDESANKPVCKVGEPTEFNFKARSHDEIGELLEAMDFPRAAKIAGARFVILYREVQIPVLVRDSTLYGSGHLPKFDEDLFKTRDGIYDEVEDEEEDDYEGVVYDKLKELSPYYLIPTAETVLTGLHADEILQEEQLPLRYVCWSNCFRAEAGAAGKDTRGLIRLHQFSKVELVSYTTPEKSKEEHERMTECAETILKRLGLPYRKMLLCAGDMGFSAEKTYDLEVWMPAQKKYREISSCSNCGAFQSRRMNTRFKRKGKKGTLHPHALNGSGLAVGRTMAALLENYQLADGSVALPEVLHKYMDGEKTLELPAPLRNSSSNK